MTQNKDPMELVKRYGARQYRDGYEAGYKKGRAEDKLISSAVVMAYQEGYQAAEAKAIRAEQALEADINRLKEEVIRLRRNSKTL